MTRAFIVLLPVLLSSCAATWPSACAVTENGNRSCQCHEFRAAAIRQGVQRKVVFLCDSEPLPLDVLTERAVAEPEP